MSSTECNDRIDFVKYSAEMMESFPLEGDDSTPKRVGWVIKAAAAAAGYGANCYNHAENARPAYQAMLEAFNNMMPTNAAGWDGNVRDVLINNYYLQKDRLIDLIEHPTDSLRIAIWVDDVYDSLIASTSPIVWIDAIWEMGAEGNVEYELVPDMMKAMYYLPSAFSWHFFELSTLFKDTGASKDLYETLKSAFEKYHSDQEWPLGWLSNSRNGAHSLPKRL